MIKKISILFVFTFILAGIAYGQDPQRIQFAKGKSSATVQGSTGADGVTYVVGAKSGQKIVLTLTPTGNLGIKVETDGKDGQEVLLREEKGGTYEIGLDANGDYTIFVGSLNHKPVHFSLTVKITKLADV